MEGGRGNGRRERDGGREGQQVQMMHEYYDRETTIKQLNELQQLCYQTGKQTQQHSEVLQLYVLGEHTWTGRWCFQSSNVYVDLFWGSKWIHLFLVMVYPIRLGSIVSDMTSVLLCVPTVSVHSDKLIGCGSFHTRAFISLCHMGSAGQAVSFTNPSRCKSCSSPKWNQKLHLKWDLSRQNTVWKKSTLFYTACSNLGQGTMQNLNPF